MATNDDELNDINRYHLQLYESGTPNYDENDPLKYMIPKAHFRRVPRWPNDAIDKYRKEHYNKRQIKAQRGMLLRPEQKELTEMLGHWPSEFPLHEIAQNPNRNMLSVIMQTPYRIQYEAALLNDNVEAAKNHLLEAYRSQDPRVREILEQSGTKSCVHKASKDPSRFPAMESIIVALLRDRLASDSNMTLLFGDVNHVRGLLLALGPLIAAPPKPGTIEYTALEPWLTIMGEAKIKAAAKACAECGTTDGKLVRCTGCFSVHYCSKECQMKAWIIHRPDCRKLQGKPVSDAMLAKAATALEEKEQVAANALKGELLAGNEMKLDALSAFFKEDGLFHEEQPDVVGKLQRADFPGNWHVAIKVLSESKDLFLEASGPFLLTFRPPGIELNVDGPEGGYLFNDPNNGNAKILLLFKVLYNPDLMMNMNEVTGIHINGIYVVDRVQGVKRKKAWWKQVPEPPAGSRNRCYRFIAYMETAKQQALPVPSDVDLGIHKTDCMFS